METYDILRELIAKMLWLQQEIENNGGAGNWENGLLNLKYSDVKYRILDLAGLEESRENFRLCNSENPADPAEVDQIMYKLYRASEIRQMSQLNWAYLEV